MIFEPLAEYLEANISGTSLKQGSNLFINQMPLDVTLGVLLKNTYAGIKIDPYITGLRSGKVNLVVRGFNHGQVRALVFEAINLLILDGVRLSDEVHVHVMRPESEPLTYATSQANQIEMSVNLSVKYAIVA